MRRLAMAFGVITALASAPIDAQEMDVRAELLRRGAPTEFADQVEALVRTARDEGLPYQDLANKALEGWAKRGRVPSQRVVSALVELTGHFRNGREAARGAGIEAPDAPVISSAGWALARGMTADQIGEIIRAAPTTGDAAAGLTVASSLGAQGLEHAAAVRAVNDAFRGGASPERILELPSAIASLVARGVPMSDVARSILEGRGVPGNPGLGFGPGGNAAGGRPPGIPPGRGPPDLRDIPGKAKGKGQGKKNP